MSDYRRDFIAFAITSGVLRFGSFVTKSGRTTPYFLDAGLFNNACKKRIVGRDYDELSLVVLVALKLGDRHQPTPALVIMSASRCVALMAII